MTFLKRVYHGSLLPQMTPLRRALWFGKFGGCIAITLAVFFGGLYLQLQSQSSTTIVTSWEVPGVVSAQALTQSFLQFVDTQTVGANSMAIQNYSNGCRDWTTNAFHNRDLGLPQQPKPLQPAAIHFVPRIDGATNPIKITITTTVGPDLAGKPCADLPPVAATTPNNFVLGQFLGGGWWSAGPGDSIAAGVVVTGPDSKRYQKIGSPVGNGWYLQVN